MSALLLRLTAPGRAQLQPPKMVFAHLAFRVRSNVGTVFAQRGGERLVRVYVKPYQGYRHRLGRFPQFTRTLLKPVLFFGDSFDTSHKEARGTRCRFRHHG
jgi:hypothetical protein